MTPSDYPKRPKFFALRFGRVMAKVCLANEIGPEACWMLAVIAHTEDAKGYRDAVTFYNGQLQAFVGCGSDDALNRMRAKAIRAGWLHYEPGGKGKAGRYWVVIPERHRDWDDAPSDESSEVDDYSPANLRGQARDKPGESAGTSEGQAGGKPGESADLSSLSLPLFQNTPQPPAEPGGGVCEDEPENGNPEVGPKPAAVAAHWNAQPGLLPCIASEVNRNRMIRNWATQNPLWVMHWRAAIAFMGRTPFYCGGGDRGWRPDLGWLLQGENLVKVVEQMLAEKSGPRAPPKEEFRKPTFFGTQPAAKDIR